MLPNKPLIDQARRLWRRGGQHGGFCLPAGTDPACCARPCGRARAGRPRPVALPTGSPIRIAQRSRAHGRIRSSS